jgi:hypothetical protein
VYLEPFGKWPNPVFFRLEMNLLHMRRPVFISVDRIDLIMPGLEAFIERQGWIPVPVGRGHSLLY